MGITRIYQCNFRTLLPMLPWMKFLERLSSRFPYHL